MSDCIRKFKYLISLLALLSTVSAQSWQNRAACVLTNGMRTDKVGYQRTFKIDGFSCQGYSNMNHLAIDGGLSNAATAHSQDMAQNNYFSHDTQNPQLVQRYGGNQFNQRVSYFYKGSAALAENIVMGTGLTDMEAIVSLWGGSYGHCINIFGDYDRFGFGMGGTQTVYSTEEFSKEGTQGFKVISCGSHLPRGNQAEFIVSFQGQVSGVDLVLDNKRIPMQLVIGTSAAGVYSVTTPVSSSCQNYKFEAKNGANVVDSYPQSGSYQTASVGSCSSDGNGGQISAPVGSSQPAQQALPKSEQKSGSQGTPAQAQAANKPKTSTIVQSAPPSKPTKPIIKKVYYAPATPPRNIVLTGPTAPKSPPSTTPTPGAPAVGDAAATTPFKANSIDLSNPSTISGIVVPGILVLGVVVLMGIYIHKNVTSGDKWNSPKQFKQDGAHLVRTLTRGKGKMNRPNLNPPMRASVYKTPSVLSRFSSVTSEDSFEVDSRFLNSQRYSNDMTLPSPAVLSPHSQRYGNNY